MMSLKMLMSTRVSLVSRSEKKEEEEKYDDVEKKEEDDEKKEKEKGDDERDESEKSPSRSRLCSFLLLGCIYPRVFRRGRVF